MRVNCCLNENCINFVIIHNLDGIMDCGGNNNNCLIHEDVINCDDRIELKLEDEDLDETIEKSNEL